MIGRFGLFLCGAILLPVMVIFAVTPLAWILAGRPNESYPEIVFAFAGVPLAFVAVVAGALVARGTAIRSLRNLAALRGVAALSIAGCAWLLWSGFAPWQPLSDGMATTVLAAICVSVPILGVGLAILAAVPLMRVFSKGKSSRSRSA